MSNRIIEIAVCCAILLSFSTEAAVAQTNNFYQTGQIRVIVSEVETKISSLTNSVQIAGYKIPLAADSNVGFFFTYSTFENGEQTEKWLQLPNDRTWSSFSNQSVRISGSLRNNKLSNIAVSPLTALSESYLTNPPATVGRYKIVAVPLTIQPISAQGKADNNASITVTPEAIRNTLFNSPISVNEFYREASYGMLEFTGVHHPQGDVVPVTIQAAISNDCQNQITNQFTPIVRQRLLEQNIDTTNGSVDLGIIIFNDTPGCPSYPFATRGALGQRGLPQWVWMPESWFVTGPSIVAHEMGHAFGGNHPLTMRCVDFDNPQTCVAEDAADRDLMTSAGRYYMMPNNYERRRWGWHPPGAFDNARSGSLEMFDLHSPIIPFVKNGAKQGRFYFRNLAAPHLEWDIYPEARRNWGQFERYQQTDEAFRLGIAVRIGHSHYGDPSVVSILLDPNNTPQHDDAPLRQNQQISIGGAVIKTLRESNPNWGTRMSIR